MTDDVEEPITGQIPVTAAGTFEIHRPREGRKARNWGVFFGGLALLILAIVGVPALVHAARSTTRSNSEQVCRARISQALSAINAALILDQTNLFLSALSKQDTGPSALTLSTDRDRAALLLPVQQNAVQTCHDDPSFQPPGGTP